MRVIHISCQHENHGGIGMYDDAKNEESFQWFLEDMRSRGCEPTVVSYDLDNPKEIER